MVDSNKDSDGATCEHCLTIHAPGSVKCGAKIIQTSASKLKRSISKKLSENSISLNRESDKSEDSGNILNYFKREDDDTDSDVAKPADMAKSFVNLLTTATMYTGNMQDIISENFTSSELDLEQQMRTLEAVHEGELEELAELKEKEEAEEEEEEEDEDASMDSDIDQEDQILPEDLEEIKDEQTFNSIKLNFPQQLQRRPTLFELSVEEKLKTKDGSSSDDCQERVSALTGKLKKSFNVDEKDTFIADYPCWLLKDVLLQGHIYLTQSHLMFFAFLPKTNKEKPALTGNLSMEVMPSMRLIRYYTILQDNTLSLYNKSTDLYFPVLTIDLKNVIRVEIIGDSFIKSKGTWIKILTDSKSYKLQADSKHAARSWVGFIRKQVFAACNKGNEVTIKFPLQNILSIERNQIFESTETLKFKVLENQQSFVYDDYFFMFFHSGKEAHDTIDKAMKPLESAEFDEVIDSTSKLKTDQPTTSMKFIPSSLKNVLKFPHGATDPVSPSQTVEKVTTKDDNNSTFSISSISNPKNLGKLGLFKQASSMWSSAPTHYEDSNKLGDNDQFLAPTEERDHANARFQKHFSLPESHKLTSSYYAHLHKNIPIYGKIYISNKEICFRSLLPGTNTKMILPLSHLENVYKEKGFKFGFSGLVLVISGYEELFFEFSWSTARDDCEYMLLKQVDSFAKSLTPPNLEDTVSSVRDLEAAKIRLFEDKIFSESGFDVPIIFEDHPLLKTNIKPGKSYKFGLLTIGSRGDVQPYIALGIGLIKEGHEVTIMTHLEFKDWIEKYGIKFKEIAGNPAELMALMVEHGSMNVGLLKEASSKFRGWITELLISSWEACQDDCDVLIESPSAMAGIHIAEALGIPYFRAFTMPWTRTRAYPHAFIVPDQKKGGSYNYLTHVLFENIFWKGISSQVNQWRKETLGLRKTNLDIMQQGKVPFLYNVSPTVMPPPVDYNDWVKVTGYWFLNESSTYTPDPKLLEFMESARKDGKKLIYIGFGSIVVSNSKELTKAVIESVLESDVRCILNKGWSERLDDPNKNKVEVELPKEIYNSGSIPHDWLFPQIDAAIHHGGSGTTGATLRSGLPTIIKPFFGDQFFYANRVEDIGAGLGLKKLNVKSLASAIKEVTTNSRIIAKAKDIGEKINREDGVKTAIDNIYRDMEYARELVLNKKQTNSKKKEEEVDDIEDVGLEKVFKDASADDSDDDWTLL